jgi:high-affinity iron transporter
MRRQSASVKGELHAALDRVLTEGTVFGLVILAFTAVIREGLETSLFLVGLATSPADDAASVLVGAVIGLAIAVLLGAALYHGSRVVNLRTFFRWTGIGLIFIAAGLLSSAIHEFVEIGVIRFGSSPAFDISSVLPHEAIGGAPSGLPLVAGQFLRALFGYSSQPEVVTLLVWGVYVVVVLALFVRPITPRAPRLAESAGTKATG